MSGYGWTAAIPILLALYTMQKTEHDQINKVTPHWLAWLRRLGFIFMASALCDVWLEDMSWRSLMLVYATGVYSLAINALALHLRAKGKTGAPYASPTYLAIRRRRSF